MNTKQKREWLIDRQYKKQRAEQIRRWIIVGLLVLLTLPPCACIIMSMIYGGMR